jgi:MFS family permease
MNLNQRTLKLDLFRCSLNGILEVGFNVFVILIAIRFLDASQGYKSILAAGSAFGFFLMPWTVRISKALNRPVTQFAGVLMLVCSVSLFFCSQVKSILPYTIYLVIAQISLSQMPGLMIHVYSSNYKSNKRGQNISLNFIFASVVGMIFSYSFGLFLDSNGSQYNYLFIGMGFIASLASIALFSMPSSEVKNSHSSSKLFGGLTFVFRDDLFGKMLFGWMLMGLGVIMTIPLRIEYMAGSGGIGMSNEQVAMIVVIYSFAGVLTSRIWGKLFDRVSFIPYRVSLNFFLLLSVLIFFSSHSFLGLAIGSALAGVANGGASIAWSLWVTKLAPKGLEAEYMGAHVFMTGIRGACAPFLGYLILGICGFEGMAYFSCTLIFISGLIFLTALKSPRLMV